MYTVYVISGTVSMYIPDTNIISISLPMLSTDRQAQDILPAIIIYSSASMNIEQTSYQPLVPTSPDFACRQLN